MLQNDNERSSTTGVDNDESSSSCLNESDYSMILNNNPLLLSCIDAGDKVLYDARIFHRGRGNNTHKEADADRPVLVLRWDAAHTPPPGAGLIVTTANILYLGKLFYAGLFLLGF